MRVAVIGAGFAGLTTAKHLTEFGHQVTVFEKAPDVGGVWSLTRSYPGVSTQNGKDTYHLSDFKMPKEYPEWPSGPQVQAYLQSYADHFGVTRMLRLSTLVEKAVQDEGTKTWTITSRKLTGDGAVSEESYDFLIIANGIFSTPMVPDYAGAAAFKAAGGQICHSCEFLKKEEARGKNVLVIGYGKSSCDIAVGLADVTSSMTVVARHIIWKAPKKFMNVLNYKYLLLTRMGEALFPYIQLKGFEKFLHGLGKPVRNSMVGSVQSITTKQLKLKEKGLLPDGPFEKIARSTVSLVTDNFFEYIDEGKIKVERDAEIEELVVDGGKTFARLSNGERLPADIVICGTGWKQEVPFLDRAMQDRILDNRGNFRLYKCVLPTGVENLAFNGYNSSFFSPLSAEMGALWIAAYLMGDLNLPSNAEQWAITDARLKWMEERTEGKHAKGTNIIPFSMHQIDDLLTDLRMPVGPLQRFMEWQMPVKPGSYVKVAKKLKARQERLRQAG